MDPALIKAAVNQVMPFGKYAGRRLFHLPEPYLVWFHKQGFPNNKLGEQLAKFIVWKTLFVKPHQV